METTENRQKAWNEIKENPETDFAEIDFIIKENEDEIINSEALYGLLRMSMKDNVKLRAENSNLKAEIAELQDSLATDEFQIETEEAITIMEITGVTKEGLKIRGEGLKIHTVTGAEFEVKGPVTCKHFPDQGLIYYCAGQSWPEEIVQEVLNNA